MLGPAGKAAGTLSSWVSPYYASVALFRSVLDPQSRDWVLRIGYWVLIIRGLLRIRNAVLIIISVAFSIICSLAFSLSSRRKHGRQGADWAPGDVEVPIVPPPPVALEGVGSSGHLERVLSFPLHASPPPSLFPPHLACRPDTLLPRDMGPWLPWVLSL